MCPDLQLRIIDISGNSRRNLPLPKLTVWKPYLSLAHSDRRFCLLAELSRWSTGIISALRCCSGNFSTSSGIGAIPSISDSKLSSADCRIARQPDSATENLPHPSNRRQALVDRARVAYGSIRPCAGRELEECFTEEEGRLHFWFNAQDGSTRMLIEGRPV